MNARNGNITLWQAYAITKALAAPEKFESNVDLGRILYSVIKAGTSKPLKGILKKKYITCIILNKVKNRFCLL